MTAVVQGELFPVDDRHGLPDPGRPGGQAHRAAGDTERAAAHRVSLRAGTLRQLLLERLVGVGGHGLTGSEAVALLNRDGRRAKETSVRPRLPELVRDGWVVDSGDRRRADPSQPAEIVYAATDIGRAVWTAWLAELADVR